MILMITKVDTIFKLIGCLSKPKDFPNELKTSSTINTFLFAFIFWDCIKSRRDSSRETIINYQTKRIHSTRTDFACFLAFLCYFSLVAFLLLRSSLFFPFSFSLKNPLAYEIWVQKKAYILNKRKDKNSNGSLHKNCIRQKRQQNLIMKLKN